MNLSSKIIVFTCFLALGGCASLQGGTTSTLSPGETTAPAAASANNIEDNHRLLSQGQAALDAGDFHKAYANFSRLLEGDPGNVDALVGLGESLLGSGESQKALGVFAKIQKSTDRQAVAWQGQGLALIALNDYAAAEGALDKALEIDSKLWRAWNARGSIKDHAGLWQEARKDYDHALEINPDAIAALNNKGMSYLMEKRYPEAELVFKNVLRQVPGTQQARANLRLALAWQGKYVEALTGTSKQEMPVVLNNLGYIAAQRGDYEFAEAYLVQAIQLSPSYYAKAAENLELVKQLRNADKTQKRNLVQEKQN